jgi:hypothetical protein
MKRAGWAMLGLVLACQVNAGEANLEALSELSTEGTTTSVAPGGEGKLVITIRAKGDSHVSEEAPLKVQVSAEGATPSKDKLGRADLSPGTGTKGVSPRFEVPFRTGSGKEAQLKAEVTYFICTQDVCARQLRKLTVPVTLQSGKP